METETFETGTITSDLYIYDTPCISHTCRNGLILAGAVITTAAITYLIMKEGEEKVPDKNPPDQP